MRIKADVAHFAKDGVGDAEAEEHSNKRFRYTRGAAFGEGGIANEEEIDLELDEDDANKDEVRSSPEYADDDGNDEEIDLD